MPDGDHPEDDDAEPDGERASGGAEDARQAADAGGDGQRTADAGDDVSRRWLIRALVGLGIGIPVLVEARTLYHMLAGYLAGGGGGRETTAQSTTSEPTTGVGDELLPGTEPRDTLAEAELRVADDGWVFHATVAVENAGDAPYTLELGAVTTNAGTRVDGGADSGRVPPGESRSFDAEWVLPTGETPDALAVAGVVHADGGDDRTERTVALGNVPTRG
ncbi:hypothetical protein [Halobacterium yunchengense]|uniref:hypothetical protein n=1 Tax=Halobacterium yunchengense TaxID=3108497 RepID=UPI003008A3AF